MSNPCFSFKHFTVYHHKCGMKVTADGVTLGAWANVSGAYDVLDVGTGSGLIALMLAQRSDARIDGVEIEPNAVEQAIENINASPWKERIHIWADSFQHFSRNSETSYDLIVSNPPYFVNSLKNTNADKALARHTDTLTHSDLIDGAALILKKTGRICLILPVKEAVSVEEYSAVKGFFCNRKVFVLPKPNAEPKRVLLELSRTKSITEVSFIQIETENRHEYTPEYSMLVRDFYLKL